MPSADPLEQRVLDVVQSAIRTATGDVSLVIGLGDSMETVPGWDSLTFMSVWAAVNEAFAIDPDFDDAINYISVPALVAYLRGRPAAQPDRACRKTTARRRPHQGASGGPHRNTDCRAESQASSLFSPLCVARVLPAFYPRRTRGVAWSRRLP